MSDEELGWKKYPAAQLVYLEKRLRGVDDDTMTPERAVECIKILIQWFDVRDSQQEIVDNQVQQDLRAIADLIGDLTRCCRQANERIAELEKERDMYKWARPSE